jgi:rhodanese-related sulfurtransferase
MNRSTCILIWAALALGLLLPVAGSEALAQANLVSKEELKGMLDRPDVVVIDVRQAGDLEKSNLKIKGAVREDPRQDVKAWADKYSKDKTIVLYCA